MAMSPEIKERLAKASAWIDEHADKSADELGGMMNATVQAFLAELDGLSEAQWAFSSGEKEWSIKEVCLHMAHSARGCGMSIPVLASGKSIEGDPKPSILDDDPGSNAQVRENLESAFGIVAKAPARLEGNPNPDATMKHPYFGALNCWKWTAFSIMHAQIHTRQIKRIKGDASFPGA